MHKPLAGIKVLELARILAGPWIGQLLADLGADVVKVERPVVGDDTRTWGPPFVEGADGETLSASYFHSTNRGKRSVAADFETDEGQAVVRKLAAHADVVIENFKVGGLKKYGLDHEALSALNPRLITCSVTGFGQDGPYAPRAGYDFMVQGLGGIMSLTGEPEGEPVKTAVAFADVFTGVYGTVAILAALQGRHATGKGCHIDMALLDTQVSVLGNQALVYLVSGMLPPRMGNEHTSIVPYQVFPTSDGHIIVACGNDGQFQKFCGVLGTTWHLDPDYSTNPGRVTRRDVLIPLIAAETGRHTKADLLARLGAVNVPVGPINDLAEVFSDPQVVHRGMRLDLPDPRAKGGTIPSVRSPIVIDGVPMAAETASPQVGDHTQSVLADPAWGG
ncbi:MULTISPECIES: CaiB/BaiF CoA-transferase family protein [Methylobacterium]|uniref:CaiB/BaiF CoA-transferase family protein n=1 Tax=Methylobacterium ajmalii TaxID=2738439 RepID=A0ABV0A3J0_9HYPH|nr:MULTISPECIES: CaiB/BaiF CoA-transferase family protein [Methylobacterium]MBK3395577.1 CoA transferase [Methylobacterium ajmalii]MBK3408697.1 CoA transferase [Methylobacterium ajmalii]MBK3423977.1 CoA transferase [Methylobacterium ajmalii]MBZ6415766.1 CoA transferase [Methylobacterium sp.]SFE33995.1 Crotonobetainyl-CoA:carnitine CoA-transferase CaiB [Methylobacterium sp. yr596]